MQLRGNTAKPKAAPVSASAAEPARRELAMGV